MPQPLSGSYTLGSRPMMMDQYPQHAIGIAQVAAEWAALENHLIGAYSFCLFAFHPTAQAGGSIAKAAWHSLDSLKARISLLEAIAAERVPSDLLSEFTRKVAPQIRKRARERNAVVHAYWHTCAKYPDDLIAETPNPKDRLRYSVKDFDEIARRIVQTSNEVASYWFHVRDTLRPELREQWLELQRGLPPQPLPTQQESNSL